MHLDQLNLEIFRSSDQQTVGEGLRRTGQDWVPVGLQNIVTFVLLWTRVERYAKRSDAIE
jgi:hypothetical protein